MLLLRLGTSDDQFADVPEHLRAGRVAVDCLAAAVGEPVEAVTRIIWPDARLPGLVDAWLDRYHPDVVSLKVNSYWFTYESVPLRLRRRFGRTGRMLARAGEAATADIRARNSWLYHLVRRLSLVTVGGDTHFTIDQVLATIDPAIRRILAREDIALVVRGTDGGRRYADLTSHAEARHQRRRREMHERLRALCASLHVPYAARDEQRPPSEMAAIFGKDGFHRNAEGQRLLGLDEGAALVAAWRALHAPEPAAPRP